MVAIEHAPHVCHGGHVPSSDVLVEPCVVKEHHIHVCHGGHVPRRDVGVEIAFHLKNAAHVRDQAHVPVRHAVARVSWFHGTRRDACTGGFRSTGVIHGKARGNLVGEVGL